MSIRRIMYGLIPLLLLFAMFLTLNSHAISNKDTTQQQAQLMTIQAEPSVEEDVSNVLESNYIEDPEVADQDDFVEDYHDNTPVESQPVVNIAQGDRIHIGQKNCTAGYVDMDTNQLYLAGHCTMSLGEKIYNDTWEEIGEVIRDDLVYHEGEFWLQPQDFSIVQLYGKNSHNEPNVFTGDGIVGVPDVEYYDEVCAYGATTQQVFCGHIEESDDGLFVFSLDGDLQKGDSGGPVWIPQKGLIGTVSGTEDGLYTSSYINI